MSRTTEKTHLEILAAKLGARVTLDSARDWHIARGRGNIHVDGAGYSVYADLGHGRTLEAIRRHCERVGATVRQCGDREMVAHVPNAKRGSISLIKRMLAQNGG